MKVAVTGSRTIPHIPLAAYLPPDTTEIITGGAKGVDTAAEEYAKAHKIPVTVFTPDYARYRRGAPLKRNEQIAQACELLLAFWDGKSRGTAHTIAQCRKRGKPVTIILCEP